MKKLIIIILLIALVLSISACRVQGHSIVTKENKTLDVITYQEIGFLVVITTNEGVHITSKRNVEEVKRYD